MEANGRPVEKDAHGRDVEERRDWPIAVNEPAQAGQPVAKERLRHLNVEAARPVLIPIGFLVFGQLQRVLVELIGVEQVDEAEHAEDGGLPGRSRPAE